MDNKLYSRKFFVAIAAESLATGLLMGGFISSEQWHQVTMAVVGAYLVAQGFADGRP